MLPEDALLHPTALQAEPREVDVAMSLLTHKLTTWGPSKVRMQVAEVVEVNLLDRIDQRLSDTRARLNPHDFEDCATSLLSPIHPGLVPIIGGSDFGLDAEITEDSGITGLIITSSRSWDGAKRSLRDSLASIRKNRTPVQRVVAVNLAEANRSKREKLKDIAKDFDCELVQVYDRAWFANQFRENPDWRRKVLNIEGGPFSFSRQPPGARPDEQQLSTIGRDAQIVKVNESSSDVILFGVPGVGKSHVASKLDGALFLERQPTPERLLDDLIETKPALVVVDDSGARLQDVDLLRQLRDSLLMCSEGCCVLELLIDLPDQRILRGVHFKEQAPLLTTRQLDVQRQVLCHDRHFV